MKSIDIHEIALQLTLKAIENGYISKNSDTNETYVGMSKGVAENVTAFYNAVLDGINTEIKTIMPEEWSK